MKAEAEILEAIKEHYNRANRLIERGSHPSDYESAWNSALEWVIGKDKANVIRRKYGFIEVK